MLERLSHLPDHLRRWQHFNYIQHLRGIRNARRAFMGSLTSSASYLSRGWLTAAQSERLRAYDSKEYALRNKIYALWA